MIEFHRVCHQNFNFNVIKLKKSSSSKLKKTFMHETKIELCAKCIVRVALRGFPSIHLCRKDQQPQKFNACFICHRFHHQLKFKLLPSIFATIAQNNTFYHQLNYQKPNLQNISFQKFKRQFSFRSFISIWISRFIPNLVQIIYSYFHFHQR